MKKRQRLRGEGTLHRMGDGRYRAAVSAGFDEETGKRIRVFGTGRTVDAALAALERAKSRRYVQGRVQLDPGTIAEYLNRWLRDAIESRKRAATYHQHKVMVTRYLIPEIGTLRMNALTPARIERLYGTLRARGVGARTQKAVHVTLRQALRQAVRWQVVTSNPTDAVDAPAYSPPEMKTLTGDEARRLLAAARGNRLEALYVLALTTGMRQGEIFGLRWSDIDFAQAQLTVHRSVSQVNGPEVGPTKTGRSRRTIALSASTIAALRAHQSRLKEKPKPSDHVFTDSIGGLLDASNFLSNSFKPLLLKAGLATVIADSDGAPKRDKSGSVAIASRIRFHDLRHTVATLMLSNGEHPKVVAELLGHADITTTLRTYSHVMPTMHRDATSRLEALVGAMPLETQVETPPASDRPRKSKNARES